MSLERRVDPGLGAFLPVAARHAHRAYDLAIDEDGKGARLVSGPTPAAAFGGAEIAFVMLRNLSLVELIQGRSKPDV